MKMTTQEEKSESHFGSQLVFDEASSPSLFNLRDSTRTVDYNKLICGNCSTISSPQVPYDPPLSPHAQQYLGASGRFESRKMFAQQNNRYGSPKASKPQPYQTPSKFKMFWQVKSADEILLFITLRLPITVVYISQLESHGHGWRGLL